MHTHNRFVPCRIMSQSFVDFDITWNLMMLPSKTFIVQFSENDYPAT